MRKFLIPGFALLVAIVFSPPASAIRCARVQEEGKWVNLSPGSFDITGIAITAPNRCPVRHAVEAPDAGPRWYVEVTERCGFFLECGWGRMGAESVFKPEFGRDSPLFGPVELYPIFVAYNRSGVRRHLYIHMSLEEEGMLDVHVYTTFPGDDRARKVERFRFRHITASAPPGMPGTVAPLSWVRRPPSQPPEFPPKTPLP